MLLDWAIHTSLMQKILSHSYQSKHHMCFCDFLWIRITIVALVLQLICYYNTSWVSGWFSISIDFLIRNYRCGWFFILEIIVSNFLKIGNGWVIVVKYAKTVVYIGTHFFPQFLENSRSHSNVYNLISSKS